MCPECKALLDNPEDQALHLVHPADPNRSGELDGYARCRYVNCLTLWHRDRGGLFIAFNAPLLRKGPKRVARVPDKKAKAS